VIAAEAGGTLERILELILTAYPWCASRRPSGASADGPTCRCQSFPWYHPGKDRRPIRVAERSRGSFVSPSPLC